MLGRAALACAALSLAACAPSDGDPGPPSVLLVSIDTLRADHLGCYGYGRDTTPRLDALARSGALFEDVASTSSWTLPSHASILTGRLPAFHGVQDDGVRLGGDVPTLAEGLRGAGYATLAVVAHVYVSSAFGFERGFDVFDDSLIEGGKKNPRADTVIDLFLEHLDRLPPDDGRPFFGFVHVFDPHWDYAPPAPFDARFTDADYAGPIDGTYAAMQPWLRSPMPAADLRQLVALYDGEVAWVDAEIGRLFDGLRERGRLAGTVVAVTSDHGEEFGDHGSLGHGRTLHVEQLRVPLIVAGVRELPRGTRRGDPVSILDLVPTLLELAGAPRPAGLDGRSLLREPGDGPRTIVAESLRLAHELRALRHGPWKVIHEREGDSHNFYDVQRDPGEQRPTPIDPTGGELTARLEAYARSADAGWRLTFVNLTRDPLHCRVEVASEARLVDPRAWFSANLAGSTATVSELELLEDRRRLVIDVDVDFHMGSVHFVTDPPDAPIALRVELEGADGQAALWLGSREALEPGAALELSPDDPRLADSGVLRDQLAPGLHVRARPASAVTQPAELPRGARERLRELGYVDGDG